MPYRKDSLILVVQAGEDGYFSQYHIYNVSPPPVSRLSDLLGSVPEETPELNAQGVPTGLMNPGLTNRQDRISVDKAALIAEFTAAVNGFLDT